MSVSANGVESGWRHDASWWPRLCMNRLRCNCRVMASAVGWRSAGRGPDRAMIGLGDEKGTVALRRSGGLLKFRGFRRGQRGEDLLLIALDPLRPRHHRHHLRKTLKPSEAKR